jgi:hypothetical protein
VSCNAISIPEFDRIIPVSPPNVNKNIFTFGGLTGIIQ